MVKTGNYIKSIVKAVSVLESFTPDELELSPAEIALQVKIPTPTAYRILATLAHLKLLQQDPKTGKYSVGPALYMLGSLYLDSTDILKAANSAVKALNDITSEVTNMAIFDKGYVTLVIREESKYDFRWSRHIGSVLPAYASAMGMALLSEMTETEIDRIYPEEKLRPITSKTIATRTELKLALEQIRKTGISFNREGSIEGIAGIASVVHDASSRAIAAISFSVPLFRMKRGYRQRLATMVKMGTSLISYRLGYKDGDNPVHDIEEIRSWWEANSLNLTSHS